MNLTDLLKESMSDEECTECGAPLLWDEVEDGICEDCKEELNDD